MQFVHQRTKLTRIGHAVGIVGIRCARDQTHDIEPRLAKRMSDAEGEFDVLAAKHTSGMEQNVVAIPEVQLIGERLDARRELQNARHINAIGHDRTG